MYKTRFVRIGLILFSAVWIVLAYQNCGLGLQAQKPSLALASETMFTVQSVDVTALTPIIYDNFKFFPYQIRATIDHPSSSFDFHWRIDCQDSNEADILSSAGNVLNFLCNRPGQVRIQLQIFDRENPERSVSSENIVEVEGTVMVFEPQPISIQLAEDSLLLVAKDIDVFFEGDLPDNRWQVSCASPEGMEEYTIDMSEFDGQRQARFRCNEEAIAKVCLRGSSDWCLVTRTFVISSQP